LVKDHVLVATVVLRGGESESKQTEREELTKSKFVDVVGCWVPAE